MTIELPEDLQRGVQVAVQSGRFASLDETMAEAVRLLLNSMGQAPPMARPEGVAGNDGMGIIGALREDAELLDEIVEHALKIREERPWRLNSGE